MTSFNVELDVMNSGSRNDLPAKGAASECYLCFSSLGGSQTLRVGRFENNNFIDGDIKNGGTYKNFVDITGRNANTTAINLPGNGEILVAFSIYFGSRAFDAVLSQAIHQLLSSQLTTVMSGLISKLPALLKKATSDLLTEEEKKLLASFDKNFNGIAVPIGFGKINQNAPAGSPQTIPIYSAVDIFNENFINTTVIRVGDLVANLILI